MISPLRGPLASVVNREMASAPATFKPSDVVGEFSSQNSCRRLALPVVVEVELGPRVNATALVGTSSHAWNEAAMACSTCENGRSSLPAGLRLYMMRPPETSLGLNGSLRFQKSGTPTLVVLRMY